MLGPEGKQSVILLVEDDPGDQELARRASEVAGLRAELRVASDGAEALDYLQQRERYAPPGDAPRPDLVLLDLNMPRMDGRELLRHMRADPQLVSVPVVVLTTSDQRSDIAECYKLGCNSYVTKPADLTDFVQCLQRLSAYWFDLVRLPS